MKKLLLHVCCAPCSIEPLKVLLKETYDVALYYSNSNIINRGEFDRRYDVLYYYAKKIGIPVFVDDYEPQNWEDSIKGHMKDRCRYCYRQRLFKAASFAKACGFKYLSSSLAVSIYQKFDVLTEELNNVAKKYGLISVNYDYRPLYREGQKKSIEMGMYRQKFCGCKYSFVESFEFRFKRSIIKILKKKQNDAKRIIL